MAKLFKLFKTAFTIRIYNWFFINQSSISYFDYVLGIITKQYVIHYFYFPNYFLGVNNHLLYFVKNKWHLGFPIPKSHTKSHQMFQIKRKKNGLWQKRSMVQIFLFSMTFVKTILQKELEYYHQMRHFININESPVAVRTVSKHYSTGSLTYVLFKISIEIIK